MPTKQEEIVSILEESDFLFLLPGKFNHLGKFRSPRGGRTFNNFELLDDLKIFLNGIFKTTLKLKLLKFWIQDWINNNPPLN